MKAYKLIISYDGTKYNGWQKQGNTKNTIQEKIETTLSKMLNEDIEINGSGRTDAGVHAINQVAHFHTKHDMENEIDLHKFLDELNGYLPKDIRIRNIEECDLRFHARLNAKSKVYRYRIDTSKYGNPFIRNYSEHIPESLDIDAMKHASRAFVGTYDFKSFTSNKKMKKSSVRTIYDIVFAEEEGTLLITYSGNGFLYNMVRIITGTLIEVGLGKRKPEDIPAIIEAKDRSEAGYTAGASGLSLVDVKY